MKAVIFAGGVGTRLWPLSRKNSPKQFTGLVEDKTMFQMCMDRVKKAFDLKKIYVATGKHTVDAIKDQSPDILSEHIIGEPAKRDLGPAVGLSAAIIGKDDPEEPLMYIWGADQIFRHEDAYLHLIEAAAKYLESDPHKVILFGEKPRYPNQNLGWISFGEEVSNDNGVAFNAFQGFHAKPDKETAEKYTSDGQHAWNIGDFMTTPAFILSLYEQYAPNMYADLMKIQAAHGTDDFEAVLDAVYPQLEEISLDNAIFEKMDNNNGLVVSASMGWADIGTWDAYKEAMQDSPEQPVTKGNVYLEDSKDVMVFNADDKTMVVGNDLDDLVIVNTEDVVLVARKSSISSIKSVINKLKESKHKDLT